MPVETRGDKRRGKRQRKQAREAAGLEASGSADASGARTGEIPESAPIVEDNSSRSMADHRPSTRDSARNSPLSAINPNLTFGSSMASLTPSLTPSVAELAFHRALINRQAADGPIGPDTSQRDHNATTVSTVTTEVKIIPAELLQGPTPPRRGRNTTIEEVVDEDMRRSVHPSGASLNHIVERQVAPTAPSSRFPEGREGISSTQRPDVPDNQPFATSLPPSSAAASTRSAERMSSHYHMSSILNGYGADEAPTSDLNKRREGKRRDSAPAESGGDSSLGSESDVSKNDEPVRPNQWDDNNWRVAEAAIAREREMFSDPVLYQQRHANFLANEARLQNLRVDDDRLFAEQLLAQDVAVVDDHALAQQIAREEEDLRTLSCEILTSTLEVEQQEARTRALLEAARLQRETSERSRRELAAKQVIEKLATSAMVELQNRTASRSASVRPDIVPGASATPAPITGESHPERSVEQITHTFRDRVILQRMRLQDLMTTGKSSTVDQGISWDKEGKPYELGPAPSRGSSVGTRGGRIKQSPGANVTVDARQVRGSGDKGKLPDGSSHPGDLMGKGFRGAAAESSQRQEGEHSGSGNKPDEKPGLPRKEEKNKYYNKSGTSPTAAPAGSPGGDDLSSSDGDNSSESDVGTDSRYKREIKKSSTSESDSAFEDLHQSKLRLKRSRKKSKKRGVRRKMGTGTAPGGAGSDPSDSDSSDGDSGHSRGSARTP
ncbi:hypothetical protein C8R44DRAFT_735398 [Mycena epipterygia]|nr:hypothetical protein C8R44DRAFT_735398 [Mycena epipterygia]